MRTHIHMFIVGLFISWAAECQGVWYSIHSVHLFFHYRAPLSPTCPHALPLNSTCCSLSHHSLRPNTLLCYSTAFQHHTFTCMYLYCVCALYIILCLDTHSILHAMYGHVTQYQCGWVSGCVYGSFQTTVYFPGSWLSPLCLISHPPLVCTSFRGGPCTLTSHPLVVRAQLILRSLLKPYFI